MKMQCTVNGQRIERDVDPDLRLLDLIRESLHLTGTKEGCGEGECGACTILMDGKAINSCLVLALQAARRRSGTGANALRSLRGAGAAADRVAASAERALQPGRLRDTRQRRRSGNSAGVDRIQIGYGTLKC